MGSLDAKGVVSRKSSRRPRRKPRGQRLVIIDDHPLIRRGLEQMIHSGDDGFVVCGEAGNADDPIALVREIKPDLAIVDVGLPGRDGIDLTRQLLKEFPKMAILILSMHEEAHYALRALEAGAKGYMVKHEAVENIGKALRQVLDGTEYLSPAIAKELGRISSSKRCA